MGAGPLVVTYPLTRRSRAIVEEELGGTTEAIYLVDLASAARARALSRMGSQATGNYRHTLSRGGSELPILAGGLGDGFPRNPIDLQAEIERQLREQGSAIAIDGSERPLWGPQCGHSDPALLAYLHRAPRRNLRPAARGQLGRLP